MTPTLHEEEGRKEEAKQETAAHAIGSGLREAVEFEAEAELPAVGLAQGQSGTTEEPVSPAVATEEVRERIGVGRCDTRPRQDWGRCGRRVTLRE